MNGFVPEAKLSEERSRIAVVARRVDDSVGVERVRAEIVGLLLDCYRFTIVVSNVAEELRGRIDRLRVPPPSKPTSLRALSTTEAEWRR